MMYIFFSYDLVESNKVCLETEVISSDFQFSDIVNLRFDHMKGLCTQEDAKKGFNWPKPLQMGTSYQCEAIWPIMWHEGLILDF